jgi:hypothetical protein
MKVIMKSSKRSEIRLKGERPFLKKRITVRSTSRIKSVIWMGYFMTHSGMYRLIKIIQSLAGQSG